MQSVKRNLNFSIDDSSGQVVVKVIDGDSGEVVRQIPSEEVLKLAARLDDVRSVLFETRAWRAGWTTWHGACPIEGIGQYMHGFLTEMDYGRYLDRSRLDRLHRSGEQDGEPGGRG